MHGLPPLGNVGAMDSTTKSPQGLEGGKITLVAEKELPDGRGKEISYKGIVERRGEAGLGGGSVVEMI